MKIKDKDRFIAKMVAAALLTVGVAGIGAGTYMCHNAVEDNHIKYNEDGRYIAGMVAMCVGAPSLSLGMAAYPFDTKSSNKKKENTDTQENSL